MRKKKPHFNAKDWFDNMPNEVWHVKMAQAIGEPHGRAFIDDCKRIMEKYQQYFEYEHKYDALPESVHEAYRDEMYPDRHKPLDMTEGGIECGKGIAWQIQQKSPAYKPLQSYEELIEILEESARISARKEKEDRERRERNKRIWNKHYLKHGLPFRENQKGEAY